jgi:hypothetical protein
LGLFDEAYEDDDDEAHFLSAPLALVYPQNLMVSFFTKRSSG